MSRPEGTPRLKALYVFGSKEPVPDSIMVKDSTSLSAEWNQKSQRALSSSLEREDDLWWSKKGRMLHKHISEEWANCLVSCDGIIAFDAVLCQGPRHINSPAFGKFPTSHHGQQSLVADYALPPCEGCGKSPEGVTTPASNPVVGRFPLLAPPPIMASSIRAAATPRAPASAFVPRCLDCIRERYCRCCHKWWCEECYTPPGATASASGNGHVAAVNHGGDMEAAANAISSLSIAKPKVREGLCPTCTSSASAKEATVRGASSR